MLTVPGLLVQFRMIKPNVATNILTRKGKLRDMPNSNIATKFTWDAMPKERVTNRIDRRIVSGEQAMVAHVYLEEGAIVPEHSHHNLSLIHI